MRGLSPAVELEQLTRAIDPNGVALIVEVAPGADFEVVEVAVLEWIGRHAAGPVAVVLAEAPLPASPFERLMHGVKRIAPNLERLPLENALTTWLVPWRGAPHPLSETERRVAEAIARDTELAPLFHYNVVLGTARGHRAKVDLHWAEGRLVVEIDGWPDHGRRESFAADRRRDYELMLEGYIVLRLTNDDIEVDLAREIEKIRNLVRVRRATT